MNASNIANDIANAIASDNHKDPIDYIDLWCV